MSTAALDDFGPISPELILVSPPELAEAARAALPEPRVPAQASRRPASRVALLGFYAACLATTITPLAFVVGIR